MKNQGSDNMNLFNDKEYNIYYNLIKILYKSRDIEELQNILINRIPQLVPFDSSILLFYGYDGYTVQSSIIQNLDPSLFSSYLNHYQKFDQYKEIVHHLENPPVVNRASDFLDYKLWEKNEHRADFLLPQKIYHISCLEIIEDNKIITSFSFHRIKKHNDFSRREINILYILAPVIKSIYSLLTNISYLDNLTIDVLTRREKQVFPMLFSRYSNKELANHYKISINTMKSHIRNILRKTDCTSRNDLLFKYRKYRSIDNEN